MTMPAAAPRRTDLLTPTELGALTKPALSGVLINRWLTHFGWQRKHAFQGFEPCGPGLVFGRVVERKWRDKRTNAPLSSRTLKWSLASIPELDRLLAAAGAGQ